MRQRIISNDGCAENCIKLRVDTKYKSASNTPDNTIADTYGTSSLFSRILKS